MGAKLERCRSLAVDAERLRCFDEALAAPDPTLIEGPQTPQPAEVSRIVQSARLTRDGWVLSLDDGSSWRQVGSMSSALSPQVGMKVTIRRAALGSYRLVLSPHATFKVEPLR